VPALPVLLLLPLFMPQEPTHAFGNCVLRWDLSFGKVANRPFGQPCGYSTDLWDKFRV
jgi:hypothetical protein